MESIVARRKDDMTIIIAQDNLKHDVAIENMNKESLHILSCNPQEIIGSSFFNIISHDSMHSIMDYLEYNENSNIVDIITKMYVFYLKNNNKKNIRVKIKAFPIESSCRNILKFELLLRHFSLIDRFMEYKISQGCVSEELDRELNILDYISMHKLISLAIDFTCINKIDCIIYQIKVKENIHFNRIIVDLGTIIKTIKTQIRERDVIGMLNEESIAIIMFGCSAVDASNVALRIYNAIASEVHNTVYVSYFPITEKVTLEKVLNALENTTRMPIK